MTEEEKKELEELRNMKELQELRAAMNQKSNIGKIQAMAPQKESSCSGCLAAFVVTILVMLAFALCNGGSSKKEPENFNDNSSYHQILAKNHFKGYLKDNYLKDPDSYDEISYSSVYNEYRNCYVVDLKFRARNSFGGMVIERYMADVKFDGDYVSYSNIIKLE